MDKLTITAMWDAAAEVWVADSEQIGIATEAPSLDALVAKLPTMIQDLREQPDPVPFEVVVRVDVAMQHVRVGAMPRRVALEADRGGPPASRQRGT